MDVHKCCSIAKLCPTLWLHGLQHTRLLCLPLSPRVCSNSCPLSQWCHLTISSSATLFSFCLCSFPASGSFPMNQLFISGGQNIRVSASTSVLPMNIQYWSPLGWISCLDLLAVQGTLKSLLQCHNLKASIIGCFSHLYDPTLTSVYDYWKNHSFD